MSAREVAARTAEPSVWLPLAGRVFRVLWLAQLGSNVGTWMQTVGAQWLLVHQPGADTLVPLVQTAAMLPVMLLSLPAGVLADIMDRRRLLIGFQTGMAAVAAVMAAVAMVGALTPGLLLVLLFLMGCGQAMTGPAWQAIQPQLVPRDQITAAAALGSMNVNIARAAGPALGGLLLTWVGAGAVFALNAVSFIGIVGALVLWRPEAAARPAHAERAVAALEAGRRYVRGAPVIRRILLRSLLFVVPASALWALLPVVAEQRLGLGSSGYGLLLGALGVGSVGAAVAFQRARSWWTGNQVLVGTALLFAAGTVVLATVRNSVVVGLVLLLTGAAWLMMLSTANSAIQLSLPAWVRARALAMYMLVFMGGQALGSVVWALVAGAAGSQVALLAGAGLLVLCALTVRWWPLHPDTARLDRTPVSYWPEPALAFEPLPQDGPVQVVKTYRVPKENVPRFLAAMERVGLSRRRTGAMRWELYCDSVDTDSYVEEFLVPSWEEHLRQHSDRMTGADRGYEEEAEALVEGAPKVQHLFPPGSG